MDISIQTSAPGGTVAYPAPSSTAPPTLTSAPPPAAVQPTPSDVQADALAPAVAIAPSPTPASVLAGTQDLPANVRYAPSSPPHDGASPHFDRSA